MNVERSRKDKWRDISWQSFWLNNDLQELTWLIQMLGYDDIVLYEYDQMLNLDSPNILLGTPTPAVDDMLHGMIWKSYTWVLAAYELIRTINQKLTTADPSANITSKSHWLKNEFARLRVPMAKFEPTKKHQKTDYKFPRGCTQPGRGLCWEVADGVAISRMESSDALVSFLLELKSYQAKPRNNSN
jgi:hypothetical protein